MSSGLTGLTGSDHEILFQKRKGSLFMVKVKTVFCILCVCNPLFTSQHSLFWDMRLWPLLGGTTQTRYFSNINHKELYLFLKKVYNCSFHCFAIVLHPTFVISQCWTKMPNPSPPSMCPQVDDTRPNEAQSGNAHGSYNAHRCNHNQCQGVSRSSYEGKQAEIKDHVYDVGGIRGGNNLFDKTTHEIEDFMSQSIKGDSEFQMVMDLDDLGFQPVIDPPLPDDNADELEVEQWKLRIHRIDERQAV